MYVYLGGELVVAVTEIVAVLDVRLVAGAAINEEFVRRAQAGGRMRGGGRSAVSKALVVTRDMTVYASSISPATLVRRIGNLRHSAQAWDAET